MAVAFPSNSIAPSTVANQQLRLCRYRRYRQSKEYLGIAVEARES